MVKSKKLLIDLCGVIVFFATAFFIMYAVTGKIPFFSEPRRNRRVSYRREKMEEPQVLSRGITRAPQRYMEFDPAEIETLYNNAMETGGVAARQLKSGCTKCFRTIMAFSQGANREWSGY